MREGRRRRCPDRPRRERAGGSYRAPAGWFSRSDGCVHGPAYPEKPSDGGLRWGRGAVDSTLAGVGEFDVASMRADVAAESDQASVVDLSDGQCPMRLMDDCVLQGAEHRARDGAELDHDSLLPGRGEQQSSASSIVVDGDVSGDVIALQIKGGESFRRARGYAIPCTAADRELWRSSSIPVFGVVHDAGKLHWTNLTAWARALASDMRPAAAPGDATFALDERRLPGFLGQARAYLRADGPLRCAPAAPAASFSAVHARSGRARSRDSGVDAHCRPRRHLLDAR